LWSSSAFQLGKPFLEENTTLTVHRKQSGIRRIDFETSLMALVAGVQLGGSEEVEKGYGGFCARIKIPKGLVFTSEGGPVTPMEGQVHAGPWMDFSSPQDSTHNAASGLAILCHSSTPNYPAPWILRQTGSMQNIVFPGTQRIALQTTQPIVLRYRLVVHEDMGKSLDIAALQREYESAGQSIQR
jgi:hypothetical protein